MTQADKIRAMTDEEMAHYFSEQPDACPGRPGCSGKNCYDCWLDWLKQEIPAPPQKKPLCDDCKHAIDGAVDDFAAVFCGARQGYFGQVYECDRYKDKRGDGEADSAQKPPQDPPLCASCANSGCQKCGEAMGSEKCLDYQFRGAVE